MEFCAWFFDVLQHLSVFFLFLFVYVPFDSCFPHFVLFRYLLSILTSYLQQQPPWLSLRSFIFALFSHHLRHHHHHHHHHHHRHHHPTWLYLILPFSISVYCAILFPSSMPHSVGFLRSLLSRSSLPLSLPIDCSVSSAKLLACFAGLYDLNLALLVSQNSQRDPKEYLPFLNRLRTIERTATLTDHDSSSPSSISSSSSSSSSSSLPSSLSRSEKVALGQSLLRYSIDIYLKRWDRALMNAHNAGQQRNHNLTDDEIRRVRGPDLRFFFLPFPHPSPPSLRRYSIHIYLKWWDRALPHAHNAGQKQQRVEMKTFWREVRREKRNWDERERGSVEKRVQISVSSSLLDWHRSEEVWSSAHTRS